MTIRGHGCLKYKKSRFANLGWAVKNLYCFFCRTLGIYDGFKNCGKAILPGAHFILFFLYFRKEKRRKWNNVIKRQEGRKLKSKESSEKIILRSRKKCSFAFIRRKVCNHQNNDIENVITGRKESIGLVWRTRVSRKMDVHVKNISILLFYAYERKVGFYSWQFPWGN